MPALSMIVESTAADHAARKNFSANLAALRVHQPEVARRLELIDLSVEWVYARDESLSALTPEGKWFGSCSVPLLAGREILQTLEPSGTVSCLLAPPHAGLVLAARERAGDSAPMIAVQPDLQVARFILGCCDLSSEIAQNRFWCVVGDDWAGQLRQLLVDHPGLALPTRFIRTKWLKDDVGGPMIASAQEIFSNLANCRNDELASLKAKEFSDVDRCRILLVGGRDFRLWETEATVLADQIRAAAQVNYEPTRAMAVQIFDSDAALCGSPLALMEAANACGCLVTANLCRTDCNNLISVEKPWITWVTRPSTIPAYETAGPHDALVLADSSWKINAAQAGWPDSRLRLCGWPNQSPNSSRAAAKKLAIICDTGPISIPSTIKDFSSHALLWQLIEEELSSNPLAVEQYDSYLQNRAGQLNISMDALDVRGFAQGLILPAYVQGIARLVIGAGLPVVLWGSGWNSLDEFANHARGKIKNETGLRDAVAESAGLIYCWPERWSHPIESFGKPVVHRAGQDRNGFIRNATRILASGAVNVSTTSSSINQLGKTVLNSVQDPIPARS